MRNVIELLAGRFKDIKGVKEKALYPSTSSLSAQRGRCLKYNTPNGARHDKIPI